MKTQQLYTTAIAANHFMYGGRRSCFRKWQFAMLVVSLVLVLELTRLEWSANSTAFEADANNKNTTKKKQIKKYRGWAMMHTLKAGGNSVEHLLHKVGYSQRSRNHSLYQKGRVGGYVYFEHNNDAAAAAVDNNNNRLWYDHYMAQWKDGKDAYFSALPRDEFFKIGMVREPCDYMVSIWAYSGSTGRHGFLTGRCAGTESKDNFTQFLRESILPYKFGWLSYRVSLQLGVAGQENIGAQVCPSNASAAAISRIETLVAKNFNATEAADCWVRTENMRNDLHRCLQLYVSLRGGETSMTMDQFPLESATPTPHFNVGQHKPCSEYYSERDASAVWEREGKFAEQFGYSGCCQGLLVDPAHPI
jgi:hypothetical protein